MKKQLLTLLAAAWLGATIANAQTAWTDITLRYLHNCRVDPAARWTLCGLYYIIEDEAAPTGGPEALEGYTVLAHPSGMVHMAYGTVGNVELGAAGETDHVSALAGGFVVSAAGRTHWTSSLKLGQPIRHSSYSGPINVDRVDYITFDNGWSIRPDGARLLVCDPDDRCQPFSSTPPPAPPGAR